MLRSFVKSFESYRP